MISDTNTKENHDIILGYALEAFPGRRIQLDFEHGQWFATDIETGENWSVVDCMDRDGYDYIDFEPLQ